MKRLTRIGTLFAVLALVANVGCSPKDTPKGSSEVTATDQAGLAQEASTAPRLRRS